MRRLLHALSALCLFNSLSAQVPNYVPSNGLVGWWPFSGNANDESGTGNNGTVNGATLTTDRFGNQDQCYSFDGIDDHILILSSLLPSNETSYSISLWVKANAFASNYSEIICDRDDVTFQHKYRISMADNGSSQQPGTFYCLMGDGFGETHCYDTTFLNLNVWIHYVVVFNSSAGEMQAYKNGILLAINPSTGIGSGYPNQLTSTYIGRSNSPDGFDFGFHGLIDDIGIWDRALSAAEVNGLYIGSGVGVTETLIGTVDLRVFPNPNNGAFALAHSLSGRVELRVFDIAGRQVHSEVIRGTGGRAQHVLDLSGLSKGCYTLQVQNNGGSVTQQVVIE